MDGNGTSILEWLNAPDSDNDAENSADENTLHFAEMLTMHKENADESFLHEKNPLLREDLRTPEFEEEPLEKVEEKALEADMILENSSIDFHSYELSNEEEWSHDDITSVFLS